MVDFAQIIDMLARTATAFALGAIIGIERQYRQRAAGLRTNTLVAVGAAIFVAIGERLGGPSATAHITAYVVSGVGFLGAGAIIKEGASIRGLTTAATLWGTAATGACAGAGLLGEAFVAALCVLAANTLLRGASWSMREAQGRDERTTFDHRRAAKRVRSERATSRVPGDQS
jgi:putative Mg2+ transporter-C (MgtC) family protein